MSPARARRELQLAGASPCRPWDLLVPSRFRRFAGFVAVAVSACGAALGRPLRRGLPGPRRTALLRDGPMPSRAAVACSSRVYSSILGPELGESLVELATLLLKEISYVCPPWVQAALPATCL